MYNFKGFVEGLNKENVKVVVERTINELKVNMVEYEGRDIIATLIGSSAGSNAGREFLEMVGWTEEEIAEAEGNDFLHETVNTAMMELAEDYTTVCEEEGLDLTNYSIDINYNETDGAIDLYVVRDDWDDFSSMEEEEYAMILALADHFGCDISEVIDIDGDGTYQVEGAEYMVLTDDEADERFKDYQQNLWDEMGLGSFSDWAKDHIIQNYVDEDFLRSELRAMQESYVSDIKYEEGRLAEEMEEAGVESEDEYIDYLVEREEDDLAQYFIDSFGMEWFSKWVSDNNAIDVDKVIEYIQETDGRGASLSSYDGQEDEVDVNGETYYIYRQ